MKLIIETFNENALNCISKNYGARKKSSSKNRLTNYEMAYKLINEMKKEILNRGENIIIDKGKVVFTDENWRNLSKNMYFKQNSVFAETFTKLLKKNKVISSKSKEYPHNVRIQTPNPLSKPFLFCKLNQLDNVLDIKNRIIEDIAIEELCERKIKALYTYMRLIPLQNYKKEHFKYFSKANFYRNNNVIFWIFVEKTDSNFSDIYIQKLDNILSKAVIDIFFTKYNNLLGCIDHIFEYNGSKNYDKKLLDHYLEGIQINDFRRGIQLAEQFNSSPLELTLKTNQNHPKITLNELNKLIPNLIPQNLLDIEKKNFYYWNNNLLNSSDDFPDDEENVEDMKIAKQLKINNSIYDRMYKIKFVPYNNRIELTQYLKKWNNFLLKQIGKNTYLKPVYEYFLILIKKVDKHNNSKIKIGTLRGYLSSFFNYVFKTALYHERIDEVFVQEIDAYIKNAPLADSTKKKYSSLFHSFLLRCTKYDSKVKIKSILTINKSIVFNNELCQAIHYLEESRNDFQKDIKIKSNMKSVFLIFLYYSGLRKTELRSRLLTDLVYLEETDEFIIDVNAQSLRKMIKSTKEKIDQGLKTNNSKRRVRFRIENNELNELVKKYLKLLEKKDIQFLFPYFLRNSKVYKKQAMREVFFENLNQLLKDITSRYTTLHSLRHSYVTNEIFKILNKETSLRYPLQELSNRIGHSDLNMTLSVYAHLDIIMIWMMSRCFIDKPLKESSF